MPIIGTVSTSGGKPGTPTVGAITPGNGSATVAFTPPAYLGKGGTITYVATSSPGGITGSSTTSPITVSGLSNGVSYTFTVEAQTTYGSKSNPSSASSAATPIAPYSLVGTYNSSTNYTIPSGVTKLAAYVIAGGAPGANFSPVTPGSEGGAGGGGVAFQDYSVNASQTVGIIVGGQSGTSSVSVAGSTIASVSGRTGYSSNVAGYVTADGGNFGNGGASVSGDSDGLPGSAGGAGGFLTLNAEGLTNYQVGGGGGGGGSGASRNSTNGSNSGGAGAAGGSGGGGSGGNGGSATRLSRLGGSAQPGNAGNAGSQPGGGGGGRGGSGNGCGAVGSGNVGSGAAGRIYIYTA